MKNKPIYVVKASGKKEIFNEDKVRKTIRRAGIPENIEARLMDQINSQMYDNIPTSKIYQNILRYLDEVSYPQGKTKYSLKQAIMDLGPSGYPFEKYLAEVFKSRGYEADYSVHLKGKCASHEIDVVAQKENHYCLVECKFHNEPGIKSDIKISLYVKARFDDLIANPENNGIVTAEPWLVTNTKFTKRAIKYSNCAGLKLLGWNYPPHESLRDWVDQANLYPITSLFSLSEEQKQRLLEAEIVLCRNFINLKPDYLKSFGISLKKAAEAIEEAKLVCSL